MTEASPPAKDPSPPAGWRVVSAEFIKSAPSVAECPPGDRPEFAFAGRSNVGKSSLLNALGARRGLARVSRTPGRTQLLNAFDLTLAGPGGARLEIRIMDLPGYGYAAARREIREGFGPMVEGYLRERTALVALVLLVDARRGELSDLDLALLELASAQQRPSLLVATKADKLGASERGLVRRRLAEAVGARPRDVLLTSASAGIGLHGTDGLAADLAALCQAPPTPPGELVEPPGEAVESSVEPGESSVEPVESSGEPVESSGEPVKSSGEPGESSVEPVESSVEPVKPPGEPVEPVEPSA